LEACRFTSLTLRKGPRELQRAVVALRSLGFNKTCSIQKQLYLNRMIGMPAVDVMTNAWQELCCVMK
jgi:hypothetical protein